MSCYYESYCEFYSEKLVTARKPAKCCETGRVINPGEQYWRMAGKHDGDFWTARQSVPAYHFARWINLEPSEGGGGINQDVCVSFGGIGDFVQESRDEALMAEWERVKAGEVTRTT